MKALGSDIGLGRVPRVVTAPESLGGGVVAAGGVHLFEELPEDHTRDA